MKRSLVLALLLGCGHTPSPESAPLASAPAPSTRPATGSNQPLAEPATPSEAPASAFVDDAHVRWQLVAEPNPISMGARDSLRLRIVATNEGDTTVDPQAHLGHYGLNDQPHAGLDNWFGNGLRSDEWLALPPGHTVTDERAVGELFDAPGEYDVSYTRGQRSAHVRVVVTP